MNDQEQLEERDDVARPIRSAFEGMTVEEAFRPGILREIFAEMAKDDE